MSVYRGVRGAAQKEMLGLVRAVGSRVCGVTGGGASGRLNAVLHAG